MASDTPNKRRGHFKGKKFPNYSELDDDIGEFSEASSEEIVNPDSEYDEPVGVIETPIVYKGQSEDDIPAPVNRYEYPRAPISARPSHMLQEAGSSGSSTNSRRSIPIAAPSTSSQKFGSLSALEGRPGSRSRRLHDDLEEGEIAMYRDAHANLQQYGSSNYDCDESEDEENSRMSFSQAGEDDAGALDRDVNLVEYLEFLLSYLVSFFYNKL
ncbi:hypothetical protein Tco_0871650 [Tanacetum coccineum]